jgi:hypothetical protein
MILHTVIFRLKRPVDAAAAQSFLDTLTAFGAEPPFGIGPGQIGTDLGLRPEGRSVSEASLQVNFADAEAFENYLVSAPHQSFVTDTLLPSCESWLSIQSETVQA